MAALTLGLTAWAAPALASAEPSSEGSSRGQVESGFVLETSLGARVGLLSSAVTVATTGFADNGLSVGLLAGYKSGRLLFGVDLGFTNISRTQGDTSSSNSAFLIGPEFQAALLQSDDHRVELVVDAALGFGHLFTSTTPAPTGPQDSNFYLSYQLGPGMRYWAHPHFAIQGLTGFAGEARVDIPAANTTSSGTISAHGLFASFGLVAVF